MSRIIHISSAGTNREGGMSRISHHWMDAFRRKGFETISFDPTSVPVAGHKSLLDRRLYNAVWPTLKPGDILLIHEPLSGSFVGRGYTTIVFSHGIETRHKVISRKFNLDPRTFKSLLVYPLWRRRERCGTRGLIGADVVLVTNSTDRSYVQNQLRRKKPTLFYRNGVNTHAASNQPANRRILFLGSWIDRKGISLLKDAYQHFKTSPNPPKWRFAGTGHAEDVVRTYLGAHGDSSVQVLPTFKAEEENAVFTGCDIFVLPSFMEGQPLSLLEAMNHGLCCVTTAADGQLDLIQNGKNGVLFPIGDSNAFMQSITSVLSNQKLKISLGQSAHSSVEGRAWETVANKTVADILNLLP